MTLIEFFAFNSSIKKETRWCFSIIAAVLLSFHFRSNKASCELGKSTEEAAPLKVLDSGTLYAQSLEILERGRNKRVVYVESSGHECLTPRQACGIESAARANPKMTVDIYLNTQRLGDYDAEQHVRRPGRVRSCAFNELIARQHSNVKLIKQKFADIIKGTAFWQLIDSFELLDSPWADVHISDIMRLIYLNQTGGIHLDFDNIVFRPLHCLRNTMSYSKEGPNIEHGILALDAGHPFFKYLTEFLIKNYEPSNRLTMGPTSFGKAFKSFCNQPNLTTGTFNCSEDSTLTLMDQDPFFPVRRNQRQELYEANFNTLNEQPITSAFLIQAHNEGYAVQPYSLYARLAKQYCPSVWHLTVAEDIPLGF